MSTNRKNILIVEDELLIADDIKDMLLPKFNVVGIAKTYHEAVHFLRKKQIDLVILDVALKGEKTGIDVANYINDNYQIPFIYLTAQTNESSLEKLKLTEPKAYIPKPIVKVSLITTIDITFSQIKESKIDIQVGKKICTFDPNKVMFVESKRVYLKIHMKEENKLIRYSLSKIISEFAGHLIQISRGIAVNPQFITELTSSQITLGEQIFSVSPNYRDLLLNKGTK